MSVFSAADLKKFLREEVLRDDFGRPHRPERRPRLIALYIEGTMEGMPPLRHWECPSEAGWNEDGADDGEPLDVDGLVGKIQVLCDREVSNKKATIVFRLCAILGQNVAISPSNFGPSFPFTIRPTRRIMSQDSDEASPFAQSVGEANERGLNIIGITALRTSAELLFPQLQEIREQQQETIRDLRQQLQEERAENTDLRSRLRQSEDQQLERTLKVREHAFKQRLKERGAKMVISTLTMVTSAWLAKQKGEEARQMTSGNGGGGGGGAGNFRALPPQQQQPQQPGEAPGSPSAPHSDVAQGSPANGVSQKHCATCTCTPEQLAAAPPPAAGPPVDPDAAVLMRAARDDFDIDGLFGIFAREIESYALELVNVFPVESQGLLYQAGMEFKETGKVGPILIAGICDNFSTNEQVHAIMSKIRSEKGRVALASILKDHLLKRQREVQEGAEFVSDLNTRSDRLSSGEFADVEPAIPDNPEADIEVGMPKFLTREEASKHRQQKQKTHQKVQVVVDKKDKPR